jgi:hypothetical protein
MGRCTSLSVLLLRRGCVHGQKSSLRRSSSSFVGRIDDDFVLHSPAPDIDIPRQHFFDFVWSHSQENYAERVALVRGTASKIRLLIGAFWETWSIIPCLRLIN